MQKSMYRKKKTVIVNQTRFAAVCIGIGMIVAFGINFLASHAFADNGIFEKNSVIVEVAPGDTLWDIARQYNERGKDLRSVVDSIIEINHMNNSLLSVGDELVIPLG